MKETITMEELRAIQLDILDKIHAFCTERGIRYSLGGGTLLGAVRHKGYIPWDDDIDIMLPRPDYDRFLKEFEGLYSQYTLQTYMNDDSYSFPFAKVYDNRTVLIEDGACNGIYVDVFPIDAVPEMNNWSQYIEHMHKLLRRVVKTSKYYTFQKRKLLRLKYIIKKIIYGSRDNNIRKLEAFYHKYIFGQTDYAGAICGIYAEKELMPMETFVSYITVEFEGRKYMAIRDYDAYLTRHYGDYMQLPPKEKQVSHHVFTAYWK